MAEWAKYPGRLAAHSFHIAFFAGLHWGLAWWFGKTGQEGTEWAKRVLHATESVFVWDIYLTLGVEFLKRVIASGYELWGEVKRDGEKEG